MANFEISNPTFNGQLRRLEHTDPNHADTFNAAFRQLIENDQANNAQLAQIENYRAFNTSYSKCSYIPNFILKCISGTAKYAILGDSITDAGNNTGATGGASDPSKGYASVLRDKIQNKYGTGVTFDNRGIAGQLVSQAAARFDTDILPYDYDLIGLALGTNDWNYGTALHVFENNYRKLVERCINETDADVILIGLGYFKDHDGPSSFCRETEHNKIIQKIAYDYELGYIDTYSAMLKSIYDWSDITLVSDPVHPNDLGHQLWAIESFTWFDFDGTLKKPSAIDNKTITSCTSSLISYYGGWSNKGTFASPFGDGVLFGTNAVDVFFIYKFKGNKIDLRFYRDTVCGKVDVYIDESLVLENFDLYSATYNYIPITLDELENRTHLLKVVTKTKNPLATDSQVSLNQIITYDNNLDVTNSKTFYAPSDLNLNGVTVQADALAYSGNIARYTGSYNYRVSIYELIYCSKFKLIYTKFSTYGIYDVYVDRVKVDTIDFYNSAGLYQQIKEYILTAGWHLIEIISTQTKNTSSTNYGVSIEGILAYNDKSDYTSTGVGGIAVSLGFNFYEAPILQVTPTSNCTAYISSKTEKEIVVTTNPVGMSFDLSANGY